MADRAVNDPAVFKAAYAVVQKRNPPEVIKVAWAEAGLVESNFTNHKTATNYDSLGYLQQRPSQGWKDPTNVATATTSFLDKAEAYLKKNPGASPEQIAQAVQVSALPGEYGKVRQQALELIKSDGSGLPDPGVIGLPGLDASGVVGEALSALLERIGKAADAFVSKAKITEAIATTTTKMFLPSSLLRMAAGGIGVVVLCFSVYFLGRELRA